VPDTLRHMGGAVAAKGSGLQPSPAKKSARQIANLIIDINPRFEPVIAQSGLCKIGVFTNDKNAEPRKLKESNFASLASSILSQQLSTKAAATIIKRVENECGGKLNSKKLASLKVETLRNAGCSGAKARAIKELALADVNGEVPMRALHKMDDEAIMNHLLPLYGIGKWTVEMFLMFQLERQDVWPVGDLGVRRGWEKIHRMRNEIEPKKLLLLGAEYAPYRSHVAWYCWRAVEIL
jgi:DNA-3-methyladenine glycosylase II